MSFHQQAGAGRPRGGDLNRMNRIGNLPILHVIASEQLLRQQANADTLFPSTTEAGVDGTHGLEADEIAFEVKGRPRLFPGDFGRFKGSHQKAAGTANQHTMPLVQTSLNGLSANKSLVRTRNYIESLEMRDDHAVEFLRDAIRSKIEPRGVVMTAKHYKGSGIKDAHMRSEVTLQTSGLCSLPALLGPIRAGSYVEAVPLVPSEYLKIRDHYGGSKYKSFKAQVVIREVTRESLSRGVHRDCALLLENYARFQDAFGSDSNAMQRVAAANAIVRFAQFSGLQFLAYLVQTGLVTEIAGVAIEPRAGPTTPAEASLKLLVARGIQAKTDKNHIARDERPPASALKPRAEFEEIAPILGVLMGAIPASRSNAGQNDASTRQVLQNAEERADWIAFTRGFLDRVVYAPELHTNLSFQHGYQQTQGRAREYNAYTRDLKTRNFMPNEASIAGKWVALQQNQPQSLVMGLISGINNRTKDIIGSAVGDGYGGIGNDTGCPVLLTPNGVIR